MVQRVAGIERWAWPGPTPAKLRGQTAERLCPNDLAGQLIECNDPGIVCCREYSSISHGNAAVAGDAWHGAAGFVAVAPDFSAGRRIQSRHIIAGHGDIHDPINDDRMRLRRSDHSKLIDPRW